VAGLLNGARRLSLPARIRGQRAAFTHAPQTRASRPVSASFTRVRKRKKKPPSVIRREGGQGKAGQGRAGQGRAGQKQKKERYGYSSWLVFPFSYPAPFPARLCPFLSTFLFLFSSFFNKARCPPPVPLRAWISLSSRYNLISLGAVRRRTSGSKGSAERKDLGRCSSALIHVNNFRAAPDSRSSSRSKPNGSTRLRSARARYSWLLRRVCEFAIQSGGTVVEK
jgi:hypothetical protein